MQIKSLSAFQDNYIWIGINTNNNAMFCVDPGDASPILAFVKEENYHLKDILITHHHPDHIGGVAKLKSIFANVNIYGPKDERIPFITHILSADDSVTIQGHTFNIISTPGHTRTHICYWEPETHWLFCGDTLFSAGCGRVFDGSLESLFHSLHRLKQLPDATKVYCAHEYTEKNLQFAATIEPENKQIQQCLQNIHTHPQRCTLPSTIALEKEINPFLRTDEPSVIKFAKDNGIEHRNIFKIFSYLRNLKDNF